MEWIQPLPGDASPASPNAMSGNGDVLAGFSGNPFLSLNAGPIIWTREVGTAKSAGNLAGKTSTRFPKTLNRFKKSRRYEPSPGHQISVNNQTILALFEVGSRSRLVSRLVCGL